MNSEKNAMLSFESCPVQMTASPVRRVLISGSNLPLGNYASDILYNFCNKIPSFPKSQIGILMLLRFSIIKKVRIR